MIKDEPEIGDADSLVRKTTNTEMYVPVQIGDPLTLVWCESECCLDNLKLQTAKSSPARADLGKMEIVPRALVID